MLLTEHKQKWLSVPKIQLFLYSSHLSFYIGRTKDERSLCYQCRNSLEVLRKPFFLTLLFSKPVHSFNQLNLTLGIKGRALSIRELTVWLRRWVNTSKIKIAWISAREACLEHSGGTLGTYGGIQQWGGQSEVTTPLPEGSV